MKFLTIVLLFLFSYHVTLNQNIWSEEMITTGISGTFHVVAIEYEGHTFEALTMRSNLHKYFQNRRINIHEYIQYDGNYIKSAKVLKFNEIPENHGFYRIVGNNNIEKIFNDDISTFITEFCFYNGYAVCFQDDIPKGYLNLLIRCLYYYRIKVSCGYEIGRHVIHISKERYEKYRNLYIYKKCGDGKKSAK